MSQMQVPPASVPALVSVEVSKVHYDPPRRHYVGRQLVESRDGIELLVRTSAALPVVAITPVLFIGETIVSEYETVGPNLYRFFLFDLERAAEGAPVALGWPFSPRPTPPSNFRFRLASNLPVG